MDCPTPLAAVLQLQKTFGCALRFRTRDKSVEILYPAEQPISSAYAIESVNLLEYPEYKGSAKNLYTRLYPVGKNGLSIATVNDGCYYVEDHSYTEDVICSVWRDDRYTDAQSLMSAAQARVNQDAKPVRNWKLKIVDLNRIYPGQWPELDLSMWKRLILHDSIRGTNEIVRIIGMRIFPYYPERNTITVTTDQAVVRQDAQHAITSILRMVTNPSSDYWGLLNSIIRQNQEQEGENT
jgi:hypothetical protein